jgi:hypothetical protein
MTVAARSKEWTAFASSNAVGSNLTQGIDVCLRLFCVCVDNDIEAGWSLSKDSYWLS